MFNFLVGLSVFNTLIGMENINKNTQQYTKQQLTNAKIDRILELLEAREDGKMDLDKYIEKLDTEISKLIESEAITATTIGEQNLHYLFENRKNALRWAEDKNRAFHMEAATTGMTKTYFGGM